MESMETIDCRPEANEEVTILDVLGVDLCRYAILNHMHIRDIVRSERVCRRWQRAVLDYLPRCRLTLSIYQRSRVFKHSHRTVMIRDDGTFPIRNVLEKLGFLIVSLFTNRSDPEFYEDVSSYCSRLRHIELKHLSTRGSNNISEQKLGRAFQNVELEKIKLVNCTTMHGKFLHLMNLNNSLKSLSLIKCGTLRSRHIKLNSSRLHNVTSLEMVLIEYVNFKDALLLIDNMPKLEKLSIKGYFQENEFVEHCSRLEHLKCIDLREQNVDDEFLEGLARVCKNLEYLNIASNINSPCGRGLAALVLRPSRGTLLCFTHIREESLEALLEFLTPFNDGLAARERKNVTMEMLIEASKSIEHSNSLELRLAYPVARKAKPHPELKIVLNVSLVRNPQDNNREEWEDWAEQENANFDDPHNEDVPNNIEDGPELNEEGIDHNDALDNVDFPNNIEDRPELNEEGIARNDALDIVDAPDNIDAQNNVVALDNVGALANANAPNNIEHWVE